MSYLVLARKHRPQSFAEMIGQKHITDLLAKAIQSNRTSHAYLFCGPRGIGKTSCARILAKSLNCAKGPTLKPCGKCPACEEISKATSFDVLEIDGASNRGIDEIRTLRENVKFAPSYGRFKIYIVDEVHMLTAEAFNALLKTLEEPPAHVKFILATTAPHKIPATIISRCQRFDFKRIPIQTTVEFLADISQKEKFQIDESALYTIAKAAQGSLRDALSILDQLSVLSEQGIRPQDVSSMLGLVETDLLFELVDAISQKNCSVALDVLEKIIEKGKDIKQLTYDLIEHFRNLMIIKVGGKALSRLVEHPAAVKEMFLTQSEHFTLKEILAGIDTFIEAQETSRITESTRMPLEVALAKLTYQAATDQRTVSPPKPQPSRQPLKTAENIPIPTVLKDQKGQAAVSDSGSLMKEDGFVVADSEETAEEIPEAEVASPVNLAEPPSENLDLEQIKRCWDTLTYAVSREKMSTATFLQEGIPFAFEDGKLTVGFSKKCTFQKESLEDPNNKKLVERIFSEKLSTTIVIAYTLLDDGHYTPQQEDPAVKAALDAFGGKVVQRWHND